jgi:hypothetical protein
MLRTFRFITLLLGALGLGLGTAHVLELVPKMRYDAQMYMAVTSTLYQLFGSAGAIIQVGTIFMAAMLTYLVRHRPVFRLTLGATLGFVLSLALWALLVAPVNAQWSKVMHSTPDLAAQAYLQLRPRWEYGHAAAFAAWLLGFGLLVCSVVAETPADRGSPRADSRA